MKLFLIFFGAIYMPLSAAAQCTHPDYDALIELYDSTDGPHWYDPSQTWAQGKAGANCDPCTWVGVKCNGDGRVESLDLTNRQLKGPLIDINLPSLKILKLSRGNFSSPIPDFQNMPELTYLELWVCNLSGSIPDFSNLGKLTFMDLRRNNLEGNCPNFSKCKSLITLALEGNFLSGPIPSFDNCLNLNTLHLGYNLFQGPIPDHNHLDKLQYADFFNNKLTGSIPDLSGMKSLIGWYVQNNNLSGCYPDFICDVYLFNSTNNPLLPWKGDHIPFCNGESQVGAACDDGNSMTTADSISVDCKCGQPVLTSAQQVSICNGSYLSIGDHIYDAPGIYTDTLSTASGEDSIVITTLTVLNSFEISVLKAICPGDTFNIDNVDYFAPASFSTTYTGVNGCDSIVNYSITYNSDIICGDADCNVFIPNVFTPNGDLINDYFTVFSPTFKVSELLVYDRKSSLIFRGDKTSNQWDGTFRNKLMPSGVYIYFLKGSCGNGEIKSFKGDVTLVR
ncbi:MAG: gliding motility-associated C-terminal domain-containing protein [Saprospiraceae bacterium]|jgi:gliding motility-associated-like protein|nr:gliding motility-associated C-terminal domain-containing protein [Candidatus Brachybacter algidus]MBP7306832.1 gliding motility-associated C-terminal domain-containing protein [Saprospiraceae bacterium]MBK8843571.1 gliding motility-associated C-terminal domain-containing protein [Candidatus Brachybacter algidus]MBK9025979.1 gliding motility-associated C-terminal domain-containing protein [Candidatus Brachybacter algidus]MBK9553504.1 gliding motility-associated C-terminal domain-containing pr